jgi:hypothetical protein
MHIIVYSLSLVVNDFYWCDMLLIRFFIMLLFYISRWYFVVPKKNMMPIESSWEFFTKGLRVVRPPIPESFSLAEEGHCKRGRFPVELPMCCSYGKNLWILLYQRKINWLYRVRTEWRYSNFLSFRYFWPTLYLLHDVFQYKFDATDLFKSSNAGYYMLQLFYLLFSVIFPYF